MATEQTTERAEGTVAQAQEKGQELVSQAQQQVKEKADEIRGEAGVRLREQVDERSTQAGQQVQAIGQALRRGSEQLRAEGKETPAGAIEQAAQRAEDLGSYLQQANADKILGDIENFARRRPWITAATGALAGFLASRFVKASSARRYEAYSYDGTAAHRRLETGGV
jgi:ElaB/YqjD/DUF883 family membrane-anchored ribosome-binding protein